MTEQPGIFALTFSAISQRLDRLERLAGITDKVPADLELDELLAQEDPE